VVWDGTPLPDLEPGRGSSLSTAWLILRVRREIVVPLAENAKASRSSIGAFFAHPASLLLIAGAITALLSGLLVPYITRSWQTHDREQEKKSTILHEELGVKSDLVRLIGRATADFLGASLLRPYAEPSPATGLSKFDRAYVRWTISSAEIASQLAAYFPNSPAERKWRDFSENMKYTYNLVRDHKGDERKEWLGKVRRYLDVPLTQINVIRSPFETIPVKKCHKRTDECHNQTYEGALRKLVLEIQKKERLVLSAIVTSDSSLQCPTDGGRKKTPATPSVCVRA
jgi:hypothetical protein